jgi:predicted molibdopterin-dependent oxidoreductase YjgC
MLTCIDCVWAKKIDENIRLALSQENKEILNILERRGFDIDEFCYCERLGYIESVIMKRICEEYEPE